MQVNAHVQSGYQFVRWASHDGLAWEDVDDAGDEELAEDLNSIDAPEIWIQIDQEDPQTISLTAGFKKLPPVPAP